MNQDRTDVVAVIQPFVPDYRRPLFDAIDERLRDHGLRLEVWHAVPRGRVAARGNADRGPWSVTIAQHRLSIGRRNITFRPVRRAAREVRAVVAGLASTNLETYALAADRRVRLMLWGHGRNFTASNHALDQRVEGWLTRRASHVFTYTDEGRRHVLGHGISDDDVTVVVNATDTRTLREVQSETTPQQTEQLRTDHGLVGARVALFVGAFDEPKKLPFLLEAMARVSREHPDVVLVLAGTGPDEAQVRDLAEGQAHVRFIGRLDARSLAQFSTLVDLLVMPGRIGLVAVDALALGLPVATTRYPFHAPEAVYLTDGEDSLWTDFDVTAYADGVSSLLHDGDRLAAMSTSARRRGADLSVEASADRFVAGVLRGLESDAA